MSSASPTVRAGLTPARVDPGIVPPPAASKPPATSKPPAGEAPLPPLAPVRLTGVPTKADRVILSRFSFGITPAMAADSARVGGARDWFETQLDPASIPDTYADGLSDWWPTMDDSYEQKQLDHQDGSLGGFLQDYCFQRWTLLHHMYTERQVLEVMTDFWSNLLFVNAPSAKTFAWRVEFERAIRAKALTSFVEVLQTGVLHPCMLVFLDNSASTAWAPNENLGRELLELHTVGREAGYTEAEVKDSMWILTGHRVNMYTGADYDYYYSSADHHKGKVSVLGFEHPNDKFDADQMSRDYLAHLARLPATAKRLATRLVLRFVSDQPQPALVDAVAAAYLANDTDIKATLRALIDHPEFQTRTGTKVRTPMDDLVNSFRALQIKIDPPTDNPDCAATTILTICMGMGQRPYDWPRPDGFPDVGETWSSASRMLTSWRVHKNASGGIFPKLGVLFKDPTFFLPTLPARFDTVVDNMCRVLLAKPASVNLIETACLAVDVYPDHRVDEFSPVFKYRLGLLILSILDTPDHMGR